MENTGKREKFQASSTVRTRVAPSPTGAPHIGIAYMALFNYAFARKQGGQFILRIEDTDRARSTPESEAAVFDALRWLGIPWDEGPDVGGAHGPYRQSERTAIYREHGATLVEKGAAYPCFCSGKRLAELRRKQSAEKGTQGYDGLCAGLSADETRSRMASGEPHVIRLRVPAEGECVMTDRLRGEIRIPWSQVDHQVLLKSDGFPTYHLAVVVDDHLMEITHVIRGEEWISSTPKHVLLYEHFGWSPPEFVHLPLLRNPDRSKLSKRRNPTSILYYRRAGYMPEALLNYLGLMAYSMPDGQEAFSVAEFVESFDIDRIGLGGPVFDLQKLASFNGRRLRELSTEELYERLRAWGLDEVTWKQILPLAQPRLNTLGDLVPMSAFLFTDKLQYPGSALLAGGLEAEQTARVLKIAQWEFEKPGPWADAAIRDMFDRISEREALKLKTLLVPFFVAIAGAQVSLPLFDSMALLGRDLVLRRIQYALEELEAEGCALSGKKLKKLQKEYQATYGD